MRDYNEEIKTVQRGDQVIFERPGRAPYGGRVWESPTTHSLWAGDTCLRLDAERWVHITPDPDLTVVIDRKAQ